MRNLRAEDLRPAARLVVGDHPFSMTQGIGGAERYDAAIFVGYHAGAGHPSGVIAHTYASSVVMEIRVNGIAHNEAGLNALRLGGHGTPVALVAGDDALAGEVGALLPWAERVVVKRALGGHLADSLSPERAGQEIRDGVARALSRLDTMRLHALEPPLRLEIDTRLPVMADYACVAPGVERTGPRTIAVECDDAETLYRWVLTLVRLAGVPAV
jgi:D-amino peptidase